MEQVTEMPKAKKTASDLTYAQATAIAVPGKAGFTFVNSPRNK